MAGNFGVFINEGAGMALKYSCSDAETAKDLAQKLAASSGMECYVFDFQAYKEVERFKPPTA